MSQVTTACGDHPLDTAELVIKPFLLTLIMRVTGLNCSCIWPPVCVCLVSAWYGDVLLWSLVVCRPVRLVIGVCARGASQVCFVSQTQDTKVAKWVYCTDVILRDVPTTVINGRPGFVQASFLWRQSHHTKVFSHLLSLDTSKFIN